MHYLIIMINKTLQILVAHYFSASSHNCCIPQYKCLHLWTIVILHQQLHCIVVCDHQRHRWCRHSDSVRKTIRNSYHYFSWKKMRHTINKWSADRWSCVCGLCHLGRHLFCCGHTECACIAEVFAWHSCGWAPIYPAGGSPQNHLRKTDKKCNVSVRRVQSFIYLIIYSHWLGSELPSLSNIQTEMIACQREILSNLISVSSFFLLQFLLFFFFVPKRRFTRNLLNVVKSMKKKKLTMVIIHML